MKSNEIAGPVGIAGGGMLGGVVGAVVYRAASAVISLLDMSDQTLAITCQSKQT